jgi:hypothetical protein
MTAFGRLMCLECAARGLQVRRGFGLHDILIRRHPALPQAEDFRRIATRYDLEPEPRIRRSIV